MRVSDLDNVMEVETAIAKYTLVDPVTRKQTKKPASNCYKDKLVQVYASYLKCISYFNICKKKRYNRKIEEMESIYKKL